MADETPAATEVVIGIITSNDKPTIGPLVRAASRGIEQLGLTGCIVIADAGSTDGTVEEAVAAGDGVRTVVPTEYARPVLQRLSAPYHGLIGRPAAIRALLRAASDRGARATTVLDGSLTNVAPDWFCRLLQPVLADHYDYVSPYYVRHAYEGAITKSIVYPLFRALYGSQVRQPAAGEFGCSSALATHLLDQISWERDDAETGIDIWLAAAAVSRSFRVCEADLGGRTHAPRQGAPDLATTLTQVVGAVFEEVEAQASIWQRVRGSTPVPTYGDPVQADPHEVSINVEATIEAFRLGCRALAEVWGWVMAPRTILQLGKLSAMPPDLFRMPDELWAQIVYDFALAYRARQMSREHLLGSMAPLYLGWLAAFVLDLPNGTPRTADERIETLCLAFENKKPYLIGGWRWPERFRA